MRIRTLIAAVLLSCPTGAVGQDFFSDEGRVVFTSSVPLHTFSGTSNQLVGRISLPDSTVDFYVDLSTLETGIGKRDRDMRLTLETDDFPFAEFFGKLDAPAELSASGPQPVAVHGLFKLHGVSREVRVEGTLERTDAGLRIEAGWSLNLTDYGIVPPSLLIVKVDEIQQIRIDVLLKPDSP